jgi:hypothetical protein
MFLRWKRRLISGQYRYFGGGEHRKWGRSPDDWLLSAVVVASERTADGPRQRQVCYLGSVRASRWGALRGHYGVGIAGGQKPTL